MIRSPDLLHLEAVRTWPIEFWPLDGEGPGLDRGKSLEHAAILTLAARPTAWFRHLRPDGGNWLVSNPDFNLFLAAMALPPGCFDAALPLVLEAKSAKRESSERQSRQ